MKKLLATAAIALLTLLGPERLWAQQPLPGPPGQLPPPQPAVSPYINLLRNNNPTYLNYYGLVRPQFAFQAGINGLQQNYAAAQGAAATDPLTGLPLTGHPTQFFNTSHYFFNRGGQGQASAGTVRPTTAGAAPAAGMAAPAATPTPGR